MLTEETESVIEMSYVKPREGKAVRDGWPGKVDALNVRRAGCCREEPLGWAPVTQTSCEVVTERTVQGTEPKATELSEAVCENPLPVMVTVRPPATLPTEGVTAETYQGRAGRNEGIEIHLTPILTHKTSPTPGSDLKRNCDNASSGAQPTSTQAGVRHGHRVCGSREVRWERA